jgi:hypothetical protein
MNPTCKIDTCYTCNKLSSHCDVYMFPQVVMSGFWWSRMLNPVTLVSMCVRWTAVQYWGPSINSVVSTRYQQRHQYYLPLTILSSAMWHQDREVSVYWITWYHIPEDSNFLSHCHENRKPHMQTDCFDCQGMVGEVSCDHQCCTLKLLRAEEFSINVIYLIHRMKLVKHHAAWSADHTN